MKHGATFRKAQESDIALVQELIRALAVYERRPEAAEATPEQLRHWLFEERTAEVTLIEEEGKNAGFAVWYKTFSTFQGRPGIYLLDLYLRPEFRGHGLGKETLCYLAKLTVERGYGRLEWSCLKWNTPSLEFYRKAGAISQAESEHFRLSGEALRHLAEKSDD